MEANMRKIILNLAISLDGYISKNDGGFDWIIGQGDFSADTENQFNFEAFKDSVDTVVMGSIAYEDCVLSGLDTYEGKKMIVATSRKFESHKHVEFVNGDICGRILELRQEEGKNIWLFGGAGLTDSFIKSDIIDEYIIGIIPVILGEGKKLFNKNNPTINLKLTECTVQEGIPIMRYSKR
jgi:dihydrofolate reductase